MPSGRIAETPNILLLFVDQMRFDAMGCAGHPELHTPNLDRLAAEGTRFTRAYTPVPVCIAARNSLYFGHRCATHGRFGNNVPEVEPLLYALPQLLSYHGYATRGIGKQHFRPVRRSYGYDRLELMEEIPDFRDEDEYLLWLQANGQGHVRAVHGLRHLLYMLPQRSVMPEEFVGSSWVADRTVEFIRNHRGRPFCCMSSWISPHPPFNVPDTFSRLYGNHELPAAVAPDRELETLPPHAWPMRNLAGMNLVSRVCWQRIRALYHAQVALIDKGIGRILHALEATGQADHTLVIFASDHGEMLGDQGLWQKSLPYDASARVPFLLRLPSRIAAGCENDELISLLDILPTCLDLAGLEYPGAPALPGASLLGRDGGGLAEPRSELVVEIGRPPERWVSLLSGQTKYTYFTRDGFEELYDLQADPTEEHNLLLEGAPGARTEADRMRRALVGWEREHGYAESLAGQDFANFERLRPAMEGTRINAQFPRWLDRLDPSEKALMNTLGDELAQAMAGEDTYSLDELDLDQWTAKGGEQCRRAVEYVKALWR